MSQRSQVGPDLVIAGSARSGTSYLTARLSSHPQIDPPAIKEPNFFSRNEDKGLSWYDGLFSGREGDSYRLDASMSYTFPQYPHALSALARTSPNAQMVYVVRHPIERALSHYLLNCHYFQNEAAPTFGAAIEATPVYLGASDYPRWLAELDRLFSPPHVLVVPFGGVTGQPTVVIETICDRLGITPVVEEDGTALAHRNDVVTFRSDVVRRARRRLLHSGAYPWVRKRIGPDRLRDLRSLLTRGVGRTTLSEALETCTPSQRSALERMSAEVGAVVGARLAAQDERTGLNWASVWASPVEGGTR